MQRSVWPAGNVAGAEARVFTKSAGIPMLMLTWLLSAVGEASHEVNSPARAINPKKRFFFILLFIVYCD